MLRVPVSLFVRPRFDMVAYFIALSLVFQLDGLMMVTVVLVILFTKFLVPFFTTLYKRHALLIPPKINLGHTQLVKDWLSLTYAHYFRQVLY